MIELNLQDFATLELNHVVNSLDDSSAAIFDPLGSDSGISAVSDDTNSSTSSATVQSELELQTPGVGVNGSTIDSNLTRELPVTEPPAVELTTVELTAFEPYPTETGTAEQHTSELATHEQHSESYTDEQQHQTAELTVSEQQPTELTVSEQHPTELTVSEQQPTELSTFEPHTAELNTVQLLPNSVVFSDGGQRVMEGNG